MKAFVLGFLAAAGLLGAGAYGYLKLGFAEMRNDVRPPAWSSRLAVLATRSAVGRSASREKNPTEPTESVLIARGRLYLQGCAGCHGRPGKPRRVFVATPPPPQFVHEGTSYSESEVFWITKHGLRRSGMSAYGPFYSDEEIW